MASSIAHDGIMENIAAIALGIGASKNRITAYESAADSMGGFVGFYEAAVELGTDLERYSRKRKIDWGNQADWILTTENLVDGLLDFMIKRKRLPLEDERLQLIRGSITS